jgi:hypothetical protein
MTEREIEREGDAFYNFISKIDEREREIEREGDAFYNFIWVLIVFYGGGWEKLQK